MREHYDYAGVYTAREWTCFHLAVTGEETIDAKVGTCLKCSTTVPLEPHYLLTERTRGNARVYIRKLHKVNK